MHACVLWRVSCVFVLQTPLHHHSLPSQMHIWSIMAIVLVWTTYLPHLFTHFARLAEWIARNETVFLPKHGAERLRMLCSGAWCRVSFLQFARSNRVFCRDPLYCFTPKMEAAVFCGTVLPNHHVVSGWAGAHPKFFFQGRWWVGGALTEWLYETFVWFWKIC